MPRSVKVILNHVGMMKLITSYIYSEWLRYKGHYIIYKLHLEKVHF